MKPSKRILKIYESYNKPIMKSNFEWEIAGLQIDCLNKAIAEIVIILDELSEKPLKNIRK